MAAKAARVYDLSLDEAMRLNPEQVRFMEEYAHKVAEDMFENDPELLARLQAELGPVRRQIRAQISQTGDTGGKIGPPPGKGRPRSDEGDDTPKSAKFYTD